MNLADVRKYYGKTVTYNGIQYRLDKCIEQLDNHGGYAYSAELHDLRANSVLVCRLEDIKIERD